MSVLGMGAALGSLLSARYGRTGIGTITGCACAPATAQMAVVSAHAVSAAVVAILAYGLTAGLLGVAAVSSLQCRTIEHMRERVMAVHSICFLGSSSIGGPSFSAIAEWVGVSGAMPVAAVLCKVTVAIGTPPRTKRWLDWRV